MSERSAYRDQFPSPYEIRIPPDEVDPPEKTLTSTIPPPPSPRTRPSTDETVIVVPPSVPPPASGVISSSSSEERRAVLWGLGFTALVVLGLSLIFFLQGTHVNH